jgi:hypothetical protein
VLDSKPHSNSISAALSCNLRQSCGGVPSIICLSAVSGCQEKGLWAGSGRDRGGYSRSHSSRERVAWFRMRARRSFPISPW